MVAKPPCNPSLKRPYPAEESQSSSRSVEDGQSAASTDEKHENYSDESRRDHSSDSELDDEEVDS